ncbi:hypothetical protein LTR56_000197 [Elasticomyces elasticus]|nr:hypothetical protein LTR56_000197 [Elasticomyces elasticus]KAK3667185.1 hypothetical protein LTR22_002050 [Elasticomyces elasticus]KAK4932959.1 hypothetical protein LTR49_000916 [Elasticomyces elasticus]KAK5768635.1 hypothetical protein LTS12_001060 [Elasticomyces elasticus]
MTPNTQDVVIRNAYLDTLKSGASQPDVQVYRDDLLDMLKHQQKAIDNLAVMRGGGQQEETPEMIALAECRMSMELVRSFLCRSINRDPLKTLPSERSKKAAEKVFSLPELAEIILLETDTYSMLQAMQACTALAGTIASPRIRIKLGLRAQPDGDWFSPFAYSQGSKSTGSQSVRSGNFYETLECRVMHKWEMEGVPRPGLAVVHAGFEEQRDRDYGELAELSKFGERIQSMLICQPPITEMVIKVNCCRPASGDAARWEADRVMNSQGITLGDLLRATIQYQEKHQLCPHARAYHHDAVTGFVRVEVTFQGEVHLDPDDPVFEDDSGLLDVEGRAATPISSLDEEDESWATLQGYANLQDYMDYKQKAHQSGETIVTMAEFNRSNQH